jgi:hypothetical protein
MPLVMLRRGSLWTSLFLALFVVQPAPVFAQDETLQPDGEDGGNGDDWDGSVAGDCDSAACETDVDEGADAGGDAAVVAANGSGESIIFDFPTPSANPATTASAQTFDTILTWCNFGQAEVTAAATNPTCTINAYCNGSLHESLGTQEVTSQDLDAQFTWTFGGSCASDGSDVQIYVETDQTGSGGGRRYCCAEALEWEVTHAVGGADELMVITP